MQALLALALQRAWEIIVLFFELESGVSHGLAGTQHVLMSHT